LDPAQPGERLAGILADARVAMMVSERRLASALPVNAAPALLLDADREAVDAESPRPLTGLSAPESLAYVTYTSGSTGRPKGVCVPHRAVARLVLGADFVQLGPGDRVAQAANPTFDAATFEIWGSLLTGACLVGMLREEVLAPAAFAAALRGRGVTALFLTTALFNQMARDAPQAFRGLRHLLFGGEAVDPRWVREVLADSPPRRLLHVYGPTENTTFSSWFRVAESAAGALTVPIGRPVANSRIYLLDHQLRPVPVGVGGELFLGGDGLAEGYLHWPDLTAERFVPDPCGGQPGGRLYRSGDRARQLPDGNVVFLGRIDHQLKIRGFRVEPAEIEAALTAQPEVLAAVVLAREDAPGDRRLVAYVTRRSPAADNGALARQLRERLRARLPHYLVPAACVVLAALPLTPNGKIDRAALPPPETQRRGEPEIGAPFIDPIAELIAAIWSELLDGEPVGDHDDFFALGGHSLLATRVVSRIRSRLGVDLAVRELFEAPTPAALAARIGRALRAPAGEELPPLTRRPREGDLPLSFAQERLWFLRQLEPASCAYHVPSALRFTGPLALPVLDSTFAEILRRHEILRTTFPAVAGRAVQKVAPAGAFRVPLVDLRALPPAGRQAAIADRLAEAARRPFDLAAGPLLRVSLLRLAADEHLAVVVMDHIVADGWSVHVVLREVAALYQAGVAGRPSPLAEPALQYADFAAWQRQWLRGEVLARQLAYWRQRLAGALEPLDLPADRPRSAPPSGRGGEVAFALPGELLAALRRLSRQHGSTLFMTLLAGFQTLLYRLSGAADLSVGTPVAGRRELAAEELIGCFINTLVMRTDLAGDPTLLQLLDRVREVALGAYAHQDLPFERLVEELAAERSSLSTPLFQVMLVLQNLPPRTLSLPGLTIRPVEWPATTAKFDLTLTLDETPAGLAGWLGFRSDLFGRPGVLRLAAQLGVLLAAAAADPERRLSELPLLSAAERQQLAIEWAQGIPLPRLGPLPELLAEQARRRPDALAVDCAGLRLGYGELERRSNQLAHRLRRRGAGPGARVGLALAPSLELVVALLGILKAGAAYVPLDPAYPPERLALMIADAGVALLLTTEGLLAGLPQARPPVLCLDGDGDGDGTAEEEAPPPCVSSPDDLLYVIYTSGSTGRPKGAGVSLGSFLDLLAWYVSEFAMSGADRFLVVTSPSFDMTQKNFFAPLLLGGELHLAPAYEPAALVATIAERAITRLNCTPSAFYPLLDEATFSGLASLRTVILGGEPPSRARLAPWWRSGRCRATVFNCYGPTECTATVAFHRVDPTGPDERPVAIGRPMPSARLWVLGGHLELVPQGVPGQLAAGGA
ncbi:MAG TPA: amino acid adenylation domain-containing protein, partial [Thermoanaerobaculia bacterium]